MVWFNKNKKEDASTPEDIPELPQLPKLPSLPSHPINDSQLKQKPNSLPRFPSGQLGDKFSQNTIKDAVSGEKEDEEADESEEKIEMMPKFPTGPLTEGISQEENDEFPKPKPMPKPSLYPREEYPMSRVQERQGPLFVRLDKFEEDLEIFEKIKKQLSGIEKLLDEIKQTKEEEDKELESWQSKLQTMKDQIDKIDKDIFSKIE